VDFPSFTQNVTLTRCPTLTLNMILPENKNTTHFKQRLLPTCLPHDLEIVTVNGGETTIQYHAPFAVAKFAGKRKKIKSVYFIATPRISKSPNSDINSLLYHFLQFSFTSIPTYILLKTFLLTAAKLLAISLFSVKDSAQYVATGLINVLEIFIFFCSMYRLSL